MELKRAIEIVQHLANGVNLYTGEAKYTHSSNTLIMVGIDADSRVCKRNSYHLSLSFFAMINLYTQMK